MKKKSAFFRQIITILYSKGVELDDFYLIIQSFFFWMILFLQLTISISLKVWSFTTHFSFSRSFVGVKKKRTRWSKCFNVNWLSDAYWTVAHFSKIQRGRVFVDEIIILTIFLDKFSGTCIPYFFFYLKQSDK